MRMTIPPTPRLRLAWTLALALIASAAAGLAQTRPLNILLTNDDGFDSAGLTAMHAALVEAGHHVTVVAPATNMSSSGMSMTSGTIRVEKKGESVWAVHGTPADAAMIGLSYILRDRPQDLVVSGTNAGQNLGASANSSGTVSAAIAAARFGVPAIAASAGLGANSADAYAVAAALVRQMIAALDARRAGGKLLGERLVINVNVPAVPAAQLKGPSWAPLSPWSSYAREYSAGDAPDTVRSRLTGAAPVPSDTGTDLALFRQGYVTLTVLDGDLGAPAAAGEAVAARLATLALPAAAAR
jgi:5'/3'-nucleotidase SurE